MSQSTNDNFKGQYEQALLFADSVNDIKRILKMGLAANAFNATFLLKFFGDLTPEDALSCLRDLLHDDDANVQFTVEVAKKYNKELTSKKLIKLFEEFECWTGLYLYLGHMINDTKDSNAIYKYIVAALELGQFAQIELICRENNYYDPEQIKSFLLKSNKVKDPRPLIHVCDRHGFIAELTEYLYTNQMYKFLEVYVQRMNQGATPKVVGKLLDLNIPEDLIRNLINNVRPPQCPINELVDEFEKRARLTLLLPWLENRFKEHLEDSSLHNALAKIYIDINNNPQHFCMTNKFYDSFIVGKYCESRDPHLAFICYKRASGKYDEALVNITNKHGFFKDQARYCVERQDSDLWEMVLSEENEHRRSLIDQVVATTLPESRKPDEISTTVKAFMNADLPNELIELLEKIVLSNSSGYSFRNNKNLQNLLILTAVKADPTRVAGYVDSLDNYDGPDVAKICISETYKLYDEGFLIYKKFNRGVEAINVLLYDLKDVDRAKEYAKYCDKSKVWTVFNKFEKENKEKQNQHDPFFDDWSQPQKDTQQSKQPQQDDFLTAMFGPPQPVQQQKEQKEKETMLLQQKQHKPAHPTQPQNNDVNNQMEQYIKQISLLQNELSASKQQSTQDREKIVQLKKEKQESEQMVNEVLNKQTKLMNEINDLKDELKNSKNENNKIKKQNANLNEECKELKLEIQETKNKYNKLHEIHNVKNYENWNSDNITDWIISLNDAYKMYEIELRKKLKEESLDGTDLHGLDRNDLHRFGIQNYKHKKMIMERIKQLTSPQNNDNNNNNNNNVLYNEGKRETAYIG